MPSVPLFRVSLTAPGTYITVQRCYGLPTFRNYNTGVPALSKRFTPEVSVELPSVYDAQVSPDGALVAFVVADNFRRGGATAPKMPRASIYFVPVSGGSTVKLTNSERSDTMPRWSPDGSSLAFLSDRDVDGQRQIYVLPRSGGEARRLTDVQGDIPSPRSLS